MVQNKKTKVFLTGGFGNWGRFTLRSLAGVANKVDVVALVLPTDYENIPTSARSSKPRTTSKLSLETSPTTSP